MYMSSLCIATVRLDLNLILARLRVKYTRVFCDSFQVFLKNSRVCTLLHMKLPCITRYEQCASRTTRSCNYSKCVCVSIIRQRESNLKRWQGYLFKHTYPFVLIDSVSFHAYQITVPACVSHVKLRIRVMYARDQGFCSLLEDNGRAPLQVLFLF